MKNLFILILLLCLTFVNQIIAQETPDKKVIAGSWLGKIQAGAITLRVVFNLSLNENDSIRATLDSPDQGVKNILIGPVKLDGRKIEIQAPLIMGIYNGSVSNDTLIEGTWRQGPQSTKLDLVKLKKEFALNRPQEPKSPFPYTEREVTFRNEKFDIDLAGALTIPEGKGPFPVAVLATGSGAQNRNEELMGHKPFLVIADHLTRNGIAVLRYDDRGVGKSQGNYASATSEDLATDAASALNFIKTIPELDHAKSGIIGHSEGSLIAAIVASQGGFSWVVSLAGPGVRGDQIILRQSADISRASGIEASRIQEDITINKELFSILRQEKDLDKASEKMKKAYEQFLDKKNTPPDEKEKLMQQIAASFNPASLGWMRYFTITDPSQFWKKVKCPVLALNGENDLQVAADENLPAIEKAIHAGGNNQVTTVSLPKLNHLFQHSDTGLPAEYGKIEETFSTEALTIMTAWIHSVVQ